MVKAIDDFKERFDFLFKPLIKIFEILKIKPLHITIISFISGFISAFFLYSNHALFVLFALLHLFLDKIDGTLARLTNNVTEPGKWLDYILDSLVLFFLLIGSYIVFPSVGINIFFTNKFVLVTLLLYLTLNILQIFIKKRNTFGSHLIGIVLFMFKKYQYAVIVVFLISIYGTIYQIIQKVKKK